MSLFEPSIRTTTSLAVLVFPLQKAGNLNGILSVLLRVVPEARGIPEDHVVKFILLD